ncbi:MAG: MaoC family dehydratase [Betaproteobacteria bacterium]|nr:MAG: MaoC family dehydratase [Betaproteobacteria bacterium]
MGLYYEQYKVGQEFNHPWTRTVTETDNILICSLTMNVQPMHLDAEFAGKSEYGKPLVNSIFTLGLVIGMTINDTTLGTTLANLQMESSFPKPVFAGDTLRSRTRVLSMRESKSRPNAGIIEFEHHGINQRNEVVCICKRAALMLKRPT